MYCNWIIATKHPSRLRTLETAGTSPFLLLAKTMGVRTHGQTTISIATKNDEEQKKKPRDHIFRATDKWSCLSSLN